MTEENKDDRNGNGRRRLMAPFGTAWWAAVGGIAYLFLAYGFDWWGRGSGPNPWGVAAIRLVGAAICFGLILGALELIKRASVGTRILMLAWAAYLGAWAAVFWPGFVMGDTYGAFRSSQAFPINDWHGYFKPLAYGAALDLVPEFWFITLVQVGLAACVLGLWDLVLARHGAHWILRALPHLLLAINVAFVSNMLLLSRDTPFSLTVTALAALAFHLVLKKEVPRRPLALAVTLLSAMAVIWRTDGVLVAVPALLVLLWSIRAYPRAMVRYCAAAVALVAFVQIAVPLAAGRASDDWGYELSVKLNPLGYILQGDYFAENKEEVLAAAGAVVDQQMLMSVQKPDEIASFWWGGVKWDASEADKERFRRVYTRLLLDNLPLFLAGRIETTAGSSGLRSPIHAVYDHTSIWNELDRATYNDPRPMEFDPPFPELRAKLVDQLRQTAAYRGLTPSGSVLHWNYLPELLVLLAALFLWRLAPAAAAAALVVTLRAPAVMLLAPASHFKYYLSLEITGPFVLAAMLAELSRRFLARS
ncbi:MAG TPA: hypothetical protein VGN97_05990 [Mesorhizobium sp.]|jgi:hypothetical protein|nr:hypothetical protein [Mesorhizobium sp.]